MDRGMKELIEVSREYGSDSRWVLVGGGNTSLKNNGTLFVKASGYPLATIDSAGFAVMDRSRLAAIWDNTYPDGEDSESVVLRERLVFADLMAARVPGEERRPSVEAQLHDLLPWYLVVHLHPTLVNGLTCAIQGEAIAADLFSDDQLWIPATDPGYVLAKTIRGALERRSADGLGNPDYIFLANHGVFAGGESSDEVRRKYQLLEQVLTEQVTRNPGSYPVDAPIPANHIALELIARKEFGANACISFVRGGELDRYLATRKVAQALTGCLTPDHIVYAGPGALYLKGSGADIPTAWEAAGKEYRNKWGRPANVILFPDLGGAMIVAAGDKALANARLLLDNALDVAAYTESFGGPKMLQERFVRFIVDWEVEDYRSKMTAETPSTLTEN